MTPGIVTTVTDVTTVFNTLYKKLFFFRLIKKEGAI